MKIALTIFILIISYCQAQSLSKHNLSAGLLGNGTAMNDNTIYHSSLFTGGVSINYIYQYRKEVSLITGIDYLQKGGTGDVVYYNSVGDKVGGYQQNLYLNYFQIPILLRFETTLLKSKEQDKPSKLIGMLGFGGYVSLLADGWTNPQVLGVNHNVSEDFNFWDKGILTYVGIGIPINNKARINLAWNYGLGIGNVSTKYQSNTTYNALQLALQYNLPSNK